MPSDPSTAAPPMALLLTGQKKLELVERPAPAELEPHQVRVKIRSVGVCGSDISYWYKGRNGLRVIKDPHILGHEAAGECVALGSDVEAEGKLKIGTRVAIEPSIGCMKCEACRKGMYNVCPSIIYGGTPPHHGSFQSFVSHPASFVHPIPDSISFEEGAFLQPLSIVVHAVRRVGMKGGDKVFIAGSGPIGTLCALLCHINGARHITITDPNASRLAMAYSLVPGLRTIELTPELLADPVAVSKLVREGDGTDTASEGLCEVALDCCGTKDALESCIGAAGIGGSVLMLGMGGGGRVEINVALAQSKELDIKALLRTRNAYAPAIELVRSGKVDLKKLITSRYSLNLEDAQKGFQSMQDGRDMKIIFNLE